jgi:DNA modification methylase
MQGDVLERLKELPNDYIDVIVTSPPYWGLRDYKDPRQIGLEPNPLDYITKIVQVCQEIKRVLKPTGSFWLNLGDTYFGGNGQCCRPKDWGDLEVSKIEGHAPAEFIRERNKQRSNWLQPKQKMLIPERIAITLQEQGWILRNTIVWHKVNHMPESCRDRLTRSWESVFFFVKSERYFFDLDAIRKPLAPKTLTVHNKYAVPVLQGDSFDVGFDKKENGFNAMFTKNSKVIHDLRGCNPGDVWSLTNEGLGEEHFAAFPQKLVKRILEAAAPKEICAVCGKAKTRIVAAEKSIEVQDRKILETQHRIGSSSIFRTKANTVEHKTLGWKTCNCNAGFHTALVLDPFAGAGTTLLVAHKMGYDWLGIELVPKYCEIIEKRIAKHGRVRLDKFMLVNSSGENSKT